MTPPTSEVQLESPGEKTPLWIIGAIIAVWTLDAIIAVRADLFRVVDDSFFYLVVADHLAAGHGSTFNNVLPTNGYHPIWAMLLTPIAWLTTNTETYFDAALAFNRLIACAATLLFADFAWRNDSRWSAGALAVALFWLHALRGTALSEAAVAALTLALTLRLFTRYSANTLASVTLGIASGLLALSRLDMVFLLAPLGLHLLYTHRHRPSQPILWGAVTLAVMLPYLLWNWINFHHLTPISGATKTTFPHPIFRASAVPIDYHACLALAWLTLILRRRTRFPLKPALFVTTLGATLQTIYLTGFTEFATHWHWYYNLHVVSAAIAAGSLLTVTSPRHPFSAPRDRQWRQYAVTCVCAFAAAFAAVKLHRGPRQAPALWAQRIDQSLPPNSLCVVNDSPGMFAFFGKTRFIPTDGLMGDYDSHHRFKQLGPQHAMRKLGARYFCWIVGYGQIWHHIDADVTQPGYRSVHINMKSLILDEWLIPFEFNESDEVVRHFPKETDGTANGFVIWKL